jgi:alpha-L-rhamnosidase
MGIEFEILKHPPKEFRPFVRWWWPGLDVEPEELLKELEELDDQGFGGAEIQAFLFGTPGEARDKRADKVHRFAPNPFYYEMLGIVLKEAKKRNMIIDLTIGSSWPPGGTQVSKDESLKTLMMGTLIEKGPFPHYHASIPKMQVNTYYKKKGLMKGLMGPVLEEFYEDDFEPIATVAVRPIKKSSSLNFILPKATPLDMKSAVDLTSNVDVNGQLTWDMPEGDWQIFSLYLGPSGMTPMLDCKSDPDKPTLVVDLFNEKSLNNYLDGHIKTGLATLEPYLGNTLRALFTDSQEIACEWFFTEDFFEEFQARRGYNVLPYFPVCYVPNRDNQFLEVFFQNEKPCFDFQKYGKRIRHDWLETISDLWAERFCAGVTKWGKKWGIQHRIQTYGTYVDMLKANGAADIPETEQLFAGGILDFLKIAGSAGIIYNKPIVSSETLVWRYREHMTTPLKWKVAADRLFVSGINQILYHGFPYYASWSKYPGYQAWGNCAANLNRDNMFWKYFPDINGYVSRCQYLLRNSKTRLNIGVYYPHYNYDYKFLSDEETVGGHLPGYDTKALNNPIVRFMKKARKPINKTTQNQQKMVTDLNSYGYNYTHLNEEIILTSNIENGKFLTGSASLEVIIFQNITHLSLPIVEKLEKMIEAGIHIIFMGTYPEGQPGFLNHRENDKMIKQTIKKWRKLTHEESPSVHFLATTNNIGLFLKQRLNVQAGLTFEAKVSDSQDQVKNKIHYIHKESKEGHFYFIRSGSQFEVSLDKITIPQHEQNLYEIDLWTGNIFAIGIENYTLKKSGTNNFVEIRVDLPPYGSRAYFFSKSKLPVSKQDKIHRNATKSISKIPIENWDLIVHKRNQEGQINEIPVKRENLETLQDWREIESIKFCSGPGYYSTKIEIDEKYIANNTHQVWLQLGKVHDAAEISINEQPIILKRPLIVPPYEAEISEYLKPGKNQITVKIIGTLRNRLVGYSEKQKKQLMPVGILGPTYLDIRK